LRSPWWELSFGRHRRPSTAAPRLAASVPGRRRLGYIVGHCFRELGPDTHLQTSSPWPCSGYSLGHWPLEGGHSDLTRILTCSRRPRGRVWDTFWAIASGILVATSCSIISTSSFCSTEYLHLGLLWPLSALDCGLVPVAEFDSNIGTCRWSLIYNSLSCGIAGSGTCVLLGLCPLEGGHSDLTRISAIVNRYPYSGPIQLYLAPSLLTVGIYCGTVANARYLTVFSWLT
jgi:hypothetical protein